MRHPAGTETKACGDFFLSAEKIRSRFFGISYHILNHLHHIPTCVYMFMQIADLVPGPPEIHSRTSSDQGFPKCAGKPFCLDKKKPRHKAGLFYLMFYKNQRPWKPASLKYLWNSMSSFAMVLNLASAEMALFRFESISSLLPLRAAAMAFR